MIETLRMMMILTEITIKGDWLIKIYYLLILNKLNN